MTPLQNMRHYFNQKAALFLRSALLIITLSLPLPLYTAAQNMPFPGPGMPAMPDMSPEEYAQFNEFIEQFVKEFDKLPPEEKDQLEKNARLELIQNNINPDTFVPLSSEERKRLEPVAAEELLQANARVAQMHKAPPQPEQPSRENEPVAPESPMLDCSPKATHSSEQVSCLLQNALTALEIMRQKLALLTIDATIVQERLNAITFYLKALNKPEHLTRLSSETFDNLYNLITQLTTLLKAEEPYIIALNEQDEPANKNPYTILGVPFTASQAEIEARYQEKKEEYDIESLKEKLSAAGISEEKIARRIRRATIRRTELEEAYEQLSDPELKYQIDRYYKADRTQRDALFETTTKSLAQLESAIELLIQDGLITELENFFTRYEPTELAQRKKMEQAEGARIREQEGIKQVRPTESPLPIHTNRSNYYDTGFRPSTPAYNVPGLSTPNSSSSFKSPAGGTSGADSGKPKGEEKERQNTKKEGAKDKPKPETKKALPKPKPRTDSIESLRKEFTRHLEQLREPLQKAKEMIKHSDYASIQGALDTPPTTTLPTNALTQLPNLFKAAIPHSISHTYDQLGKLAAPITRLKGQDAIRPDWEKHRKEHADFYEFCKKLNELRERIASKEQASPWIEIKDLHARITKINKLFEKKKPATTAAKSDKQPPKTASKTSPSTKTSSAPKAPAGKAATIPSEEATSSSPAHIVASTQPTTPAPTEAGQTSTSVLPDPLSSVRQQLRFIEENINLALTAAYGPSSQNTKYIVRSIQSAYQNLDGFINSILEEQTKKQAQALIENHQRKYITRLQTLERLLTMMETPKGTATPGQQPLSSAQEAEINIPEQEFNPLIKNISDLTESMSKGQGPQPDSALQGSPLTV